jgi:hypothetical protein
VPIEQVPAAQTVPSAHSRHAPMPLHIPSIPQVDIAAAAHGAAARGGMPLAMFEQVPGVPSAHDLHGVLQASLQQRPWAQKFDPHSAAVVQVAPLAFLPQLPLMQVLGAMQWASVVQVSRQAAVSHWNGLQGSVVAAPQTPMPSHSRAEVSVGVVPPQVGAAHCVPLT